MVNATGVIHLIDRTPAFGSKPVVGAHVTMTSALSGFVYDLGLTDGNGNAPFNVIAPTIYIIKATHEDYEDVQTQTMIAELQDIIITLAMQPLTIPAEKYPLTIEVKDADGAPVELAKVTIFKNIGKDELITDGSGRAVWEHTGIGAHTIWVEKSGYVKWFTQFALEQRAQLLAVELVATSLVPLSEQERLALAILAAFATMQGTKALGGVVPG